MGGRSHNLTFALLSGAATMDITADQLEYLFVKMNETITKIDQEKAILKVSSWIVFVVVPLEKIILDLFVFLFSKR